MTEFRTVQYQGADTKAQGYLGVPDGQASLESNANYQKGHLQRSGEALLQQNALAARNQERVDQVEQENARLSAAQMSASNEVALRASQMVGEQRLNNIKLREDQSLEIQKLQLTHQLQRDEFDLRNRQQQNQALTQFGEAMLQFSSTLWKKKAEDINKQNEELQSYGMMDELLGVGKVTVGDQIRVDQAQYTRLSKQAEAMQLAESLEKAGLPNDAARVRASSPWYLHGRQEMSIIMGASEMPDHLRKTVQEAEKQGLLQKGDPDYDLKLRTVIYDGMRSFLKESGIVNMNPTLVARYLQSGFLNAMSSISKEFNAINNQFTKQAAAAQALGDAMNSDQLWANDPAEVNKSVSQVLNTGGYEALGQLLEGTMKRARLTGDDSAVVALMQHPAMQGFQGDYAGFERTRRAEAQAAAEKANADRTRELIARFEIEAGNLASPADLPALRARYEQEMNSLPFEHARQLEKALYGFNIQDAGHLSTRLQQVLELGDERSIAEFVRNNPTLTNSQRADAQRAITARQKVLSPEQKIQLQAAKNLILETLDPRIRAQAAVNPFLKAQIDAVIKQREAILEQRSNVYWSRPEASPEGFQRWLQDHNQDIIKRPINIGPNFTVPELGEGARTPQATRAIPPNAALPYNGRNVVWMVEPSTRQALLRGAYGDVNPQRSVVVTKDEIIAWDSAYGRTGTYPRELLALAVRTRQRPGDLLLQQARLHGLRGTLSTAPAPQTPASTATPGTGRPGEPITRQYAQQAALSAGLSHRGSIWFANMMQEESGGNPTAVHDQGTGYGLFGHRLGRRDALRQYAATRGVDVSDGRMQIEFALNEIKNNYQSVWNIVTSPNPTLNDLWRAAKAWEGFSETVYTRRLNSLRNALGE